jgi:hypothetical protein
MRFSGNAALARLQKLVGLDLSVELLSLSVVAKVSGKLSYDPDNEFVVAGLDSGSFSFSEEGIEFIEVNEELLSKGIASLDSQTGLTFATIHLVGSAEIHLKRRE